MNPKCVLFSGFTLCYNLAPHICTILSFIGCYYVYNLLVAKCYIMCVMIVLDYSWCGLDFTYFQRMYLNVIGTLTQISGYCNCNSCLPLCCSALLQLDFLIDPQCQSDANDLYTLTISWTEVVIGATTIVVRVILI